MEYCAKYTTKCEPHSQTMQETFHIIVNGLKEGSSSVTVVQKLLINSIGERDFSAQDSFLCLQHLETLLC